MIGQRELTSSSFGVYILDTGNYQRTFTQRACFSMTHQQENINDEYFEELIRRMEEDDKSIPIPNNLTLDEFIKFINKL